MWGRGWSPIQPVTSPRFPLPPLPLLQRLQRASQRTLVPPLPRAAVKPLWSLPKTPGQHTRKLWHYESRAGSGLHTRAHSGFQHGSALTAGCFLPVLVGLLFFLHLIELNWTFFSLIVLHSLLVCQSSCFDWDYRPSFPSWKGTVCSWAPSMNPLSGSVLYPICGWLDSHYPCSPNVFLLLFEVFCIRKGW